MNQKELAHKLSNIFAECVQLAVAKNSDYAKVEDALENFHDFGTLGIIVRIGDKYKRLKNILQKGEISVKSESVRDSLIDTIVYCAIAVILEEK